MEDVVESAGRIGYWDLHNLALFDSDMLLSSSLYLDTEEESTPPFVSSTSSLSSSSHDTNSLPKGGTTTMDYSYSSSGYLQDALLEFTSKRRRLEFSHDHHPPPPPPTDFSYNSDYSIMNFHENYDYFTHLMTKSDSISGENICNRRRSDEEGSIIFPESSSLINSITCSSSLKQENEIIHFPSIAPGNYQEKRKKKATLMAGKVVYPFALVKPGGAEGEVTLNDINRRILMPPTRPVRHPVGEYACRPIVSSTDGPGLSGKEVMTLTRIRTHGRGTITIIRTKN